MTRRDYARLGDAILNFVFSASLTLITGTPIGIRAKNTALRRAYHEEKLGDFLDIGKLPRGVTPEDVVEAAVAVMWLRDLFQIDEAISFLVRAVGSNENIAQFELARAIVKFIKLKMGASAGRRLLK